MSRTAAFAAGSIVTIVLGTGTAYAATGGDFILGKKNSASGTTGLTSTSGPALSLSAKGPALAVNNSTLVPNLNADQVDGKDADDLLARSDLQTVSYSASGVRLDLDNDGQTDNIGALAYCPDGTSVVGGGFADYTTSGLTYVNVPTDDNGWLATTVITEGTFEIPSDFGAYVLCLGPLDSQLQGPFRQRATRATDIDTSTMKQLRSSYEERVSGK